MLLYLTDTSLIKPPSEEFDLSTIIFHIVAFKMWLLRTHLIKTSDRLDYVRYSSLNVGAITFVTTQGLLEGFQLRSRLLSNPTPASRNLSYLECASSEFPGSASVGVSYVYVMTPHLAFKRHGTKIYFTNDGITSNLGNPFKLGHGLYKWHVSESMQQNNEL